MPLKVFRDFWRYKNHFRRFLDSNKILNTQNLASKLAAFHLLLSCMPKMRPGQD